MALSNWVTSDMGGLYEIPARGASLKEMTRQRMDIFQLGRLVSKNLSKGFSLENDAFGARFRPLSPFLYLWSGSYIDGYTVLHLRQKINAISLIIHEPINYHLLRIGRQLAYGDARGWRNDRESLWRLNVK